MVGESGVGKTLAALAISYAIATGHPNLYDREEFVLLRIGEVLSGLVRMGILVLTEWFKNMLGCLKCLTLIPMKVLLLLVLILRK